MSETTSRYGIMESLNQKKLEAKKKLAGIEKQTKIKEMEHNTFLKNIGNSIDAESNNYQSEFQTWKMNKQIEIEMLQQAHARIVERMQKEIEQTEASYESDHSSRLADLLKQKTDATQNYAELQEMTALDKKAVNAEIEELDKAIESLKQISSEQSKVTK
jgi:hypothetical protein